MFPNYRISKKNKYDCRDTSLRIEFAFESRTCILVKHQTNVAPIPPPVTTKQTIKEEGSGSKEEIKTEKQNIAKRSIKANEQLQENLIPQYQLFLNKTVMAFFSQYSRLVWKEPPKSKECPIYRV